MTSSSSTEGRIAPDTSVRGSVLLDATALPENRGGVGRYVDALARELDGAVEIACQKRDEEHFRHQAPHSTIHPQSAWLRWTPVRFIWEQTGLVALARRRETAVIHSPHYTMPLLTSRGRVVTVHDATFFSHPELHSRTKRIFFALWTRISARLADVVVTPSTATRNEVEHAAGRFRASVVAHLGVDVEVFHPPTDEELRQTVAAQGLGDRPWIAFLGSLEPRKNVPALIRAFDSVAATLTSDEEPVPTLVIAGAAGWDDTIDGTIAAMRSGAEVLRLGYVPIEQLRSILGGAVLVVYPSLGEGFGLPVLEAMACAAPVLTTPLLSLPEVGGDAVAYSAPDDVSLASAMLSLLASPDRRAELGTRGLARATEFSWSKSADLHWRAYELATARRRVR